MTQLKEGDFFLPYNKNLVERARKMRKNPTPAERKLWHLLKSTRPFGRGRIRIWRQRPINHFIVDFYIPQLKLVIEVDGDSHFSLDGQAYDQERSRILEGYDLIVLRFTNHEVLHNLDEVWERICEFLPF
ncbi:endonuclease domain-containing protein [Synechocystis sp. PCC 7338]|uniref:endonuclease domain-containing protein n=1 Tax=Synechocystis sp. PCC 7338 TaxID=2732530 RepID=UPI001BAFD773|nr:endonuclease domain-containing protein [Synechocystis sp. PCC 7338]QUS61516.1 endonuclease domain-containing protein [Synechocystis sp. PCC 7338]